MAQISRKYSPYVYAYDNPIRNIDPDGMFSTDVTKNEDGTYKVVNAKADGDKNVYVVKNANSMHTSKSQVIGKTLTDRSFLDDKGNAVKGATIDLSDKCGTNFLNKSIIKNTDMNLVGYIRNATGGKIFDFKTNGPNGEVNWRKDNVSKSDFAKYMYRGMSVDGVPGLANNSGVPTIATARDIGNVGAGFMAGSRGLSWGAARAGFDGLQSLQD